VTGFHFEEFTIETGDHYLLKVFRVRRNKEPIERPPVLLIHGIVDSADDWGINDNSILHNLIVHEHDVWLLNTRGNKYSCRHTTIPSSWAKFWDFSFDEMGKYDVPATVKYISSLLKKKVAILAHSQGTTQTFVAFAEIPNMSDYVSRFLALAPIVYLTGFDKNSIYNFMITHKFLESVEKVGINRILEHKLNGNWASDWLLRLFCSTRMSICNFLMSKITDKDPSKVDPKIYRRLLEHNPSRTNVKSVKHFVQQVVHYNGYLNKFDYGKKENLKRYGQIDPPAYDVKNLNVPSFFFYGDNDLFLTEKTIEKLREDFPKSHYHFYPGWGHLCYFIGKETRPLINEILADLKEN